ncbi:putative phage terminase large subunit-like protein [Rhodococcus sp. LBL1]|nr:putative phage terminase large subunit-like protein [Rhodococcus sp. LBL1]MDH6684719.1 putative phage terminase large subunit-like protein [Rhodococcus sp. LBL2]
MIATSTGRRLLTSNDPLLFAVLYLSHHLEEPGQPPSLAQFHLDLAEYAKTWPTEPGRDCWIAPRKSGKTTWLFLLLPLWAAAHGHVRFIAAFSDSASQASDHLDTFKKELDQNVLIRKDYPDLCRPMMRGAVKRYVSQSNEQIQQANGFSFSAKGVESKSLGMKIGALRPDLILLDDIEPNESNYSVHEAEKRKRTILDSIFYLNERARVVIVGTTTMSNSIIDQIRKVGELREQHQKSLQTKSSAVDASDNIGNATPPDNSYYVRLDKGNLTIGNQEVCASEALGAIGGSSGVIGPGEVVSCLRSEIRDRTQASEYDFLSGDDSSLSSRPVREIDRSDGFISSDANDNDSSGSLTFRQESDLKSDGRFLATSTPNSHMGYLEDRTQLSFDQRQKLELARFADTAEPNRVEIANVEQAVADFSELLDAELQWIEDERINVHYYPAIVVDDEGNESSWWPESKSMDELNRVRHTRAFQMNMQNKPVNVDAQYWNEQDVQVCEAQEYVRTLISVDPAVSTKTTNDYTAIVVVSLGSDGKVYVRHAEQVRLVSTGLKDRVNELIELFSAGLVYVESNQGGNLWRSVFDGIKANFRAVHQTEPKTLRAARALDYYRKDKVRHTRHFDALEEQMYSFPKVAHDDLIDAMGTGVHYFLSAGDQPRAKRRSYI